MRISVEERLARAKEKEEHQQAIDGVKETKSVIQCRVFADNDSQELENRFNRFMIDRAKSGEPDIDIVNVTTGVSDDFFIMVLFYREDMEFDSSK